MKNLIIAVFSVFMIVAASSCKKDDSDTANHLTATFSLPSCGANDSIEATLRIGAFGSVLSKGRYKNNQKIDYGVVNPGEYRITGFNTTTTSPCFTSASIDYDSQVFQVVEGQAKHVTITD